MKLHRYLNMRLTSIHCYKGPVAKTTEKKRNLNIIIRLKIVARRRKKNDGGPTDLFHQS